MLRWRLRLAHARRTPEAGFTFVELVTAISILGVALIVMTAVLVNNLRPLQLGKQRAAATSVAQQLLEQARSLNFTDVGLVASDSTLPQNGGSDAEVVDVGGVWMFGSGCPSSTPCEPIAYATNSASHPLNPHHVASFMSGPFTLSRWVWITTVDTNLRRVTVRVQIANPAVTGPTPFIRQSTLISSLAFTTASTPLSGSEDVQNGTASMSVQIGPLPSPLPTPSSASCVAGVSCFTLTLPTQHTESISTIRNQVNCTARSMVVALAGGSTYGPSGVSTSADDDPQAGAPTNQDSGTVTTSGVPPSDIHPPWVANSSIPGSMRCLSSVLGPDAATGGDDDLPYALGTASGAATLSIQKDVSDGVAELGTVHLLDVTDSDTLSADAHGTADTGPAGTVVMTATQRGADLKALVLSSSGLPFPLNAPNGILRIQSTTTTAAATGTVTGTAPSPTVSNPTMRIWIYDPQLQLSGCTSRSVLPSPLGYCIVDRSLSASMDMTANVAIAESGHPTMRWTVTLSGSPPTTSSVTGARGTVWTAQVNPLVAGVRFCATTEADCTLTAGKVLDISMNLDLGTVRAEAVRGLPA